MSKLEALSNKIDSQLLKVNPLVYYNFEQYICEHFIFKAQNAVTEIPKKLKEIVKVCSGTNNEEFKSRNVETGVILQTKFEQVWQPSLQFWNSPLSL